eukprot:983705_1
MINESKHIMLRSFHGFSRKKKEKEKDDTEHKDASQDEVGRKKKRMVVNVLLAMTLNEEMETELLWEVSKGFDLPLVIGEQFICKLNNTKFQSASYNDCLQFILTTLCGEGHQFAKNIYSALMNKLDNDSKCVLAYHGVELKTRNWHFHEYTNCFVGKEAVSWMVANKLCDTRAHAVSLGQHWLNKKYIKHVSDERAFDDANFYYQFNDKMTSLVNKGTKKPDSPHETGNNNEQNLPQIPRYQTSDYSEWNPPQNPRLKSNHSWV